MLAVVMRLAEVVQYAKDHYDLVEINPAATNWIERQKNLKASLIMQHKPELLDPRKDIPKPDFHNEESVKNFLNEMEIRNKLIDQMPDNVIPMDFHLYEIKICEDLMEIEVYSRVSSGSDSFYLYVEDGNGNVNYTTVSKSGTITINDFNGFDPSGNWYKSLPMLLIKQNKIRFLQGRDVCGHIRLVI
uniref:hypothetical protein n=1 Tax=Agathobacter rectalis TaxID=39491 RepID=UPI0040268D06